MGLGPDETTVVFGQGSGTFLLTNIGDAWIGCDFGLGGILCIS